MKALIFGSTGQDGHYLSALLRSKSVETIGVARRNAPIVGDVSELKFVESLIKKHSPDYIFHFAANSTTKHDALFDNHMSISTGTLNILESVKLYSPNTRVFLAGSAMQFQNDGSPIHETTPFSANSPYSVARIQSAFAARYYRTTFGLQAYIGYLFNHDSPLRTEVHVNQKVAQAALRIERGLAEELVLGDMSVRKEFNFAGDIVEAIWILVNQTEIFEAVIGSGVTHTIQEWVEACFECIQKDWKPHVRSSRDFVAEYRVLQSKPTLIKSLGWKPKVSFQKLAEMMMGM